MNKTEFMSKIAPLLKNDGFRKKASYWYMERNGVLFCIFVQGSQWDKEDYYVELGIANSAVKKLTPTITEWYCRHRCTGLNGDKNILPEELLTCISALMKSVLVEDDINHFLIVQSAVKVVNQYWY